MTKKWIRLAWDYGFTNTDLETSKWFRRQVPMRNSGSSSGVLACVTTPT